MTSKFFKLIYSSALLLSLLGLGVGMKEATTYQRSGTQTKLTVNMTARTGTQPSSEG